MTLADFCRLTWEYINTSVWNQILYYYRILIILYFLSPGQNLVPKPAHQVEKKGSYFQRRGFRVQEPRQIMRRAKATSTYIPRNNVQYQPTAPTAPTAPIPQRPQPLYHYPYPIYKFQKKYNNNFMRKN